MGELESIYLRMRSPTMWPWIVAAKKTSRAREWFRTYFDANGDLVGETSLCIFPKLRELTIKRSVIALG